MDKCLYNGQIIYAIDVAKAGIDYETEIRRSHALKCCDPECGCELIYKSGAIKVAHFAHKAGNINCCYNEYSSQMTELFVGIQDTVFDRLKTITVEVGCDADIDCRISKNYRHITPITMYGKYHFAIDIMRCNRTANELDKMKSEYANLSYTPLPIVIEDIYEDFNSVSDTYYTLRYWLNYAKAKTVLVFNQYSKQYYLCRLDTEEYIFEKKPVDHISSTDVFVFPIQITDLNLTENGFTVRNFDILFSDWQSRKRDSLRNHIKGIEAQRKIAVEREEKRKVFQQENAVSNNKSNNESSKEFLRKYTELRADYEEKIYPLMKELSQELDINVTATEFEEYFKRDYNSKSRILYQNYPKRDQLKSRMKKQIENMRKKR